MGLVPPNGKGNKSDGNRSRQVALAGAPRQDLIFDLFISPIPLTAVSENLASA